MVLLFFFCCFFCFLFVVFIIYIQSFLNKTLTVEEMCVYLMWHRHKMTPAIIVRTTSDTKVGIKMSRRSVLSKEIK